MCYITLCKHILFFFQKLAGLFIDGGNWSSRSRVNSLAINPFRLQWVVLIFNTFLRKNQVLCMWTTSSSSPPPPLFSVFSTSPPLFIFLRSNHWFAEALGQNSTVVKPSPTSYTMAPMSSQAAQPTTKVPTHITPTQSTTEKETTTPTTDTKKPSKLICRFLDASNHFWAYLSVILNSTSPVMSKTNQSAFSL